MPSLLTVGKAAEQLAVSRRTLERLIQTGALPCIRLGRLVRIDPADLAAMLEGVKTRAITQEEQPACRSLNAVPSGGCDSPRQTGVKYANLLRLPTVVKPRNSTIPGRPPFGDNAA
ncbi:MAG: helix-turn-helix domain-containing protein [Candidatus Contendobacter sp.]|jgi:excisionase family DNA binding protein|nr:helix-turn-helix domain-containing protein [Candidatus Contendobacter sp.]